MESVTASCPGKVLIIGGYAVLERPNRGLVLATTARFHASAKWSKVINKPGSFSVHVKSSQYHQKLAMECSQQGDVLELKRDISSDSNPYVEVTVAHAISAATSIQDELMHAHILRILVEGSKELDNFSFEQILTCLGLHFTYKQTAFNVGPVSNSEQSNQNSMKLLAFARLFSLPDNITIRLWAQHVKSVLAEPHGTSHANIRSFMTGGMASVSFSSESAIIGMSDGAKRLLQQRSGVSIPPETCNMVTSYASSGKCLEIDLFADNDFYSQRSYLIANGKPYNRKSLQELAPYLPLTRNPVTGKVDVSKTGLGSSAAMVTAVVAAVINFLAPGLSRCDQALQLQVIHTQAQLAHNVMQGKIGSGFDVCAAVFGSLKYIRYDPQLLSDIMARTSSLDGKVCVPSSSSILSCNGVLNFTQQPFSLPRRLELICGDVCGGSETPSMSRQILAWRQRASISSDDRERGLWNHLLSLNERVASAFEDLSKLSINEPQRYDSALDYFLKNGYNGADPLLVALKTSFSEVREALRLIGELAGVPVEPKEQTELCNATEAQPGVCIAGVPGAGGFDAIFAIVISDSRTTVENFWEMKGVCALLLKEYLSHPGVEIKRN